MSARWYAVNTAPAREFYARAHLQRQGFETYVPVFERTIRHARRLTRRRASLFPSYIFVRLDVAAVRWRAINGTLGVRQLVMQGDRPAPVPHGVVEQLIARTMFDGLLDLCPEVAVGSRMKVASGPFSGLVGTVAELSGSDRVKVLLELINGTIPVSVPRRELMPVTDSARVPA